MPTSRRERRRNNTVRAQFDISFVYRFVKRNVRGTPKIRRRRSKGAMNSASWRYCLVLFCLLSFLTCAKCQQQQKIVTYTFTEFPYKENSKNEAMFREYEAACEVGCRDRNGVSKVLCTRQCVSPSCYRDLYQSDQLEEGEVDVRLNSFKGCFIQRYNRSRL